MKTLLTHRRILALVVTSMLAVGPSACGTPPPEVAPTPSTSAAVAPTPPPDVAETQTASPGSPPKPSIGPERKGLESPGTPHPPPGVSGPPMGAYTYPENMGVGVDLGAAVRALPKTRGEDGALKLKSGPTVKLLTIEDVRVSEAFLRAGGGTRLPAQVKVGDKTVEAAFLVRQQVVEEIAIVQGESETPYTWSEKDKAWVAGAPRASGDWEAPPRPEGSPASPPPPQPSR